MSTTTLISGNGKHASILDQGQFQFYTVTEHAIVFEPDCPREEWLKTVEQLTVMHESSGRLHFRCICILADALNQGEQLYPHEYAQAISDTRKWMKVGMKTIQNAMWIMKSVNPQYRRETLSLAHHELVAPLEPSEQDELLGQAEAEDMSVADLKKVVTERHPKTKRGKDRQSKNGSDKPATITTLAEAKAALIQCANVIKEHEDQIPEAWEPLLKDFYRIYRRRWMTGHKRSR